MSIDLDLPLLQYIAVGSMALLGDGQTTESNELIMRSSIDGVMIF